VLPEPFDQLIERARAGDERAFASLYHQVQPLLGRYLQVHAPDYAEDAASDAWLEVARALDRFVGSEKGFRAWVFTIARRKVIDCARRELRRPVIALPDDPDSQPGRTADTADLVVEAEATQRAIALVRTLPPDQAEVVMLRIVAGLDSSEVAALVGKSSGAVRVLAHRGVKRLARTLAAQKVEGGVTR
jgi:RNA polymerase sigma-70 factor, ECF subfamily